MRAKTLVLSIAVVALIVSGCGGDEGGSSEGSSSDAGGGSVTLTAAEFKFDPTDLSAASGDTIEFTNEDDANHTFTAKELDIDEEVEAGASTSIALDDAEAGTYDFVCKFHPDMKGTLEITG